MPTLRELAAREALQKGLKDQPRWPKGTPAIGGQWRPRGLPDADANLAIQVLSQLSAGDENHKKLAGAFKEAVDAEDWEKIEDPATSKAKIIDILENTIEQPLRAAAPAPVADAPEADVDAPGGAYPTDPTLPRQGQEIATSGPDAPRPNRGGYGDTDPTEPRRGSSAPDNDGISDWLERNQTTGEHEPGSPADVTESVESIDPYEVDDPEELLRDLQDLQASAESAGMPGGTMAAIRNAINSAAEAADNGGGNEWPDPTKLPDARDETAMGITNPTTTSSPPDWLDSAADAMEAALEGDDESLAYAECHDAVFGSFRWAERHGFEDPTIHSAGGHSFVTAEKDGARIVIDPVASTQGLGDAVSGHPEGRILQPYGRATHPVYADENIKEYKSFDDYMAGDGANKVNIEDPEEAAEAFADELDAAAGDTVPGGPPAGVDGDDDTHPDWFIDDIGSLGKEEELDIEGVTVSRNLNDSAEGPTYNVDGDSAFNDIEAAELVSEKLTPVRQLSESRLREIMAEGGPRAAAAERELKTRFSKSAVTVHVSKAEQFTKPGTANVSAADKKKLAPLARHYLSQARPFTSCVRDQKKHGLSDDHAKRRCAVLLDSFDPKRTKHSVRKAESIDLKEVEDVLDRVEKALIASDSPRPNMRAVVADAVLERIRG